MASFRYSDNVRFPPKADVTEIAVLQPLAYVMLESAVSHRWQARGGAQAWSPAKAGVQVGGAGFHYAHDPACAGDTALTTVNIENIRAGDRVSNAVIARSKATKQSSRARLDCFVSLAMTAYAATLGPAAFTPSSTCSANWAKLSTNSWTSLCAVRS